MLERSCGTIPFTITDGIIHYLLIKTDNGHCGFPKGHVEAGESELETALRETWEETSITPRIIPDFRYEISYALSNGNDKTVTYFLAEFDGERPRRNGGFEKFTYMLLPFDRALHELTFENSRRMLRSANAFLMK